MEMGVGGQPHAPATLPLFIRSGTHSTEDWVGYRNRLVVLWHRGICFPHQGSKLELSSA